jgi:sterol desaturase/sphingolipid hydroxylase (fatty acid hydroxylase superfamily)
VPTIFELITHPVSLVVFSLYAGLIALEAAFPARVLPRVAGWRARGLAAFAAFFLLSSYLPLLWGEWLAQYRLVDLAAFGTWGGAAVGLLVYETGQFAWHRAMHSSTLLWRVFHQMHHSAERHDSYGAFWFSPVDMIGWTVLGSLALTVVVGVTPEAATWVLYITTFLSVFQHANLRTPRWLGYVIQRPESHSYHHERGVHARNYADLPLFDLMFGTFHNPRDFAPETGFWHGASARVGAMLRFEDVAQPPAADRGKREQFA